MEIETTSMEAPDEDQKSDDKKESSSLSLTEKLKILKEQRLADIAHNSTIKE